MISLPDIQALAASEEPSATVLSGSTVALLLTALELTGNRFQWLGASEIEPISDSEWDEADAIIALAEKEVMTGITGTFVMAIVQPTGSIICDGSVLNRADYPRLYNKWIGTDLIIDADTFRTPDMRYKFILGADETRPPLTEGGEENHTLSLAEIPSHQHSEISAIATIINGGLEAPASAAVPSLASTGFAGSGQSHNNMPPYVALGVYVWT